MRKITFILLSVLFASGNYAQCAFKAITGGSGHSIAVKADGTLWAWGQKLYGQLGDGTSAPTPIRFSIQIGSATNWQSVSAGNYHTLAIKTDGTLWAWGSNSKGQLGDGTTVSKYSPLQIGTATDWQSVYGGYDFSLGIKTDGTLWAWGYNSNGQLGDGTLADKNIPVQVGTATNWQSACTSIDYAMAVKTDGSLWGWGSNTLGSLGNSTNTSTTVPVQIGTATNWASVSAGERHTLAIKTDGTLWAWGNNTNGQLGNGTSANGSNIPVQVGTGTNWKEAKASIRFSIGLQSNGTIWGWGQNSNSQLGLGTTANGSDKTMPTQISVDTDWKTIATGFFHSMALKTNDALWAWGSNTSGQIGNGSIVEASMPLGVICSPAVSIKEEAYSNDTYAVYPNPASGTILIKSEANQLPEKIMVMAVTGQLLIEEAPGVQGIDIQHLPAGIYIVKCFSKNSTYSTRLIKN